MQDHPSIYAGEFKTRGSLPAPLDWPACQKLSTNGLAKAQKFWSCSKEEILQWAMDREERASMVIINLLSAGAKYLTWISMHECRLHSSPVIRSFQAHAWESSCSNKLSSTQGQNSKMRTSFSSTTSLASFPWLMPAKTPMALRYTVSYSQLDFAITRFFGSPCNLALKIEDWYW